MIWLELLVVLLCIFVGARLSGIGLGTVAGLGLVVLVFIFGLPPGMPPRTVLGMILCVVTAAATMQAAGGSHCLVVIADRALRGVARRHHHRCSNRRLHVHSRRRDRPHCLRAVAGYRGSLAEARAFVPNAHFPYQSLPHSKQLRRLPFRQQLSRC